MDETADEVLKMAQIVPEYKCRRCGAIVPDCQIETEMDAESISEAFSEWLDERPYFIVDAIIKPDDVRDYKIYYSSAHVCKSGSVGRTDLIGVKIRKEI